MNGRECWIDSQTDSVDADGATPARAFTLPELEERDKANFAAGLEEAAKKASAYKTIYTAMKKFETAAAFEECEEGIRALSPVPYNEIPSCSDWEAQIRREALEEAMTAAATLKDAELLDWFVTALAGKESENTSQEYPFPPPYEHISAKELEAFVKAQADRAGKEEGK